MRGRPLRLCEHLSQLACGCKSMFAKMSSLHTLQTWPPKVPPTYLSSTALSTRDSAVSAKQCSFQYMEL